MSVNAHRDTMVMLTMELVHHLKYDVLVTTTVVQTKSVSNQESAFALHPTTLTHKTTTNVKVPVNDSLVELTQNAHQAIHQNVSAKLDLKATPYKDAATSTSAQIIRVHTVLIV